ncbi:MAG: LacI family DNA-binding transcriptional regulator [Candidatus Woesearchaeota archaeon]
MSITLKDIAEKAGVSVSTVSRVINKQKKSASIDTKNKIWKIADELGYKQKNIDSLSTKTEKKIGYLLLCPRPNMLNVFDDPYFSVIIKGIEKEIKNQNYSLEFSYTEEDLKNEDIYHKLVYETNIDGIIIIDDYLDTQLYNDIKSHYKHIVLINNRNNKLQENSIKIDREKITYQAIKYLINLNHKKIGFIGGKIRNCSLKKQERFKGYLRALDEAGINHNKNHIKVSNWEIENGFNNMKNILDDKDIPSAIFCASDLIAIGAMHAIRGEGLNIPDDISIVSYDDIKVSTYLDPPLTTIHAPKMKLGEIAVNVLDMVIRNKIDIPLNISLSASLVKRESVKKV